ncbi:Uncharacterised protein [uncultured archaeon]|nr:Uncharacterised protein [uncultured archaeon]
MYLAMSDSFVRPRAFNTTIAGKSLNLLNDKSISTSLLSDIVIGILYVPFNENNLKFKFPLLLFSMKGWFSARSSAITITLSFPLTIKYPPGSNGSL